MGRLFGTDGVRGLANRDVTAEVALDASVAAAHVLASRGDFAGHRPRALIGRDSRISGEFLSAAVAAGLASAGVDVDNVGILPTPAVAYLTAARGVDIGVVLSASHNPMPDNGIKFLARGGQKLDDDVEAAIEARMGEDWDRPLGADVGRIRMDLNLAGQQYVDHLVATIGGTRLEGLRIVIDCANGAASEVGPVALRQAGADVVVINASPDGRNINEACGSTHPEQLQAAVVAAHADLGVALDGDADRCLAVDATGELVDGDQIMGVLAVAMHERGDLRHDTLVTTVMSNLGLRIAMREAGIATVETGVGDRYVLEAMRAGGFGLGGEQSGHIIMAAHATTGDGLLTALHLAARVVQTGRPLAELAGIVRRLPQILVNVPGVDRSRTDDPVLVEAVAAATASLGDTGRVLLRPSGTEPLVRVMVEAATQQEADAVANELAGVVRERLSL
ncbi:phosphoglucosamine mutase [Cellulomonas dongxiuzhuiae]|uniref:Phosphoglucosamine mutase n=1 Tax=Cellulomonas dongxiuzhuiae TaxID=2819979 RepID=A0ABX8GGG6_9CELL|nr:phosphoglucosamine mutase [Cellulomonas dongxiuzhuiae]MBO3088501.1 phosphoglucosamine mutase [Cellulomonas dongxiuzhuiae]MBO3094167.1 phosphoglucosamine mutase [Cellulomonas dongxiuzhuiae]QWC15222.1 phosphoglucosamine mutase [Cellulomonas dongxiuzhuiae]